MTDYNLADGSASLEILLKGIGDIAQGAESALRDAQQAMRRAAVGTMSREELKAVQASIDNRLGECAEMRQLVTALRDRMASTSSAG